MAGVTNAEDKNDQRLVQGIGEGLRIFDLRPYVNAVGNIVKGAGYEDIRKYEGSTLTFHGIPNIHRMAEIYRQVTMVITDPAVLGPPEKEPEGLRDAHAAWLDALSQILTAANDVSQCIRNNTSHCLIHCSDGWDRTSQVVSTSQILLDGEARTVRGFLSLLDKDWIQGGHKFESRLGLSSRGMDRDFSPVFLQFLDIVHQIIVQHPSFFEFTTRLLVHIADVMYECRHVTFAHDSPKELTAALTMHATSTIIPCAFRDILKEVDLFLDPSYDPSTADIVLEPCISAPGLLPWREYFHRHGKHATRTKKRPVVITTRRSSTSNVSSPLEPPRAIITKDSDAQTDPMVHSPVVVRDHRTLEHAKRMCCSVDMLNRLDDDWDS
jgi:hypothetical protein